MCIIACIYTHISIYILYTHAYLHMLILFLSGAGGCVVSWLVQDLGFRAGVRWKLPVWRDFDSHSSPLAHIVGDCSLVPVWLFP